MMPSGSSLEASARTRERPRGLSRTMAVHAVCLASELPSPASGSDISREPERPRKVIHIDMDAFCLYRTAQHPGPTRQACGGWRFAGTSRSGACFVRGAPLRGALGYAL